jgi:hypothetical protein
MHARVCSREDAQPQVAAKFNLKAQEVLNRVEGLEAMGRITGLLDDRGKFIYISAEEMESVAKWIKLQVRALLISCKSSIS